MINKIIDILKKESVLNGFFFLFIAIILLNRVFLFLSVNVDCIDNDQVVMWLGAKHYSQGLFYEPRFYGQDYNTMMEALFAVPFIKSGVPIYYAVPIATHLIFLTPFLFTALYLFFKKQKAIAIIVLSVLLCMPTGYDIMNSIPRGFVTGVFFTTLFIVNVLNPKNLVFILLNTCLAYIGYLVNQNSVLVSAPFLCYLFLENYKDKKYYLYSAIGLLLAMPVAYGLNHFYKLNPDYVFYPANNYFSFEFFKDAITHLDKRFAHIGFFIEETSILVLMAFLGLGFLLYKRNKKAFVSFLIFICVIIVSFFSSKVYDGIVWPFYSYSRMYLGIPIAICLFLWLAKLNYSKLVLPVILVTLSFSIIKEINFKKNMAYHTQEKFWGHVHLNTLEDLQNTLKTYKRFCDENKVDLFVIINSVWKDDEINYAGPALYDNFPNTFKPSFERRTWRIKEEQQNIEERFIIYVADYNYDTFIKENYKDIDINRLDDYGLFLIKNNKRTTVDFVKHIKATTEGF